jgi:electron transport complex protein RnfG
MAGATITPRAVVKAVYKTLKYYDQHREALFAPAAAMAAPADKEKQ